MKASFINRKLKRHREGYIPTEFEKRFLKLFSPAISKDKEVVEEEDDDSFYTEGMLDAFTDKNYRDDAALRATFDEEYERKKAADQRSYDDRIMRLSGGKHKDAWVKALYQEKDVENDNDYDGIQVSIDCIGWVKTVYQAIEEKEKEKKEDVENDNNSEAFELCNECVVDLSDDLAKSPYGGHGSYVLNGKGGSLALFYVALKFTVDTSLEVEFVATSEEMLLKDKVIGEVVSYYSRSFEYDSDKTNLYKEMLFKTKPGVFVKPGKINLMRSVVAVPAQYTLMIDVNLRDLTSGDEILAGRCEFFVPLKGSNSFVSIPGVHNFGGRLNLKVDWKLPFDMHSLLGCRYNQILV